MENIRHTGLHIDHNDHNRDQSCRQYEQGKFIAVFKVFELSVKCLHLSSLFCMTQVNPRKTP